MLFFSAGAKIEFPVYQVSIVMVTNLLWQPSVAAAHKAHKAPNLALYLSC